jgi:hypothetical protein
MRTWHNTDIISLRYFLYKGNNFETSRRVETASRFIQEEDLWGSDELTRDTNTAFLSTTNAFSDWSTNDTVCLLSQTKGFNKSIDSSHSFRLRQCAVEALDGSRSVFRASYFLWASLAAKCIVSRTVRDPMSASSCST